MVIICGPDVDADANCDGNGDGGRCESRSFIGNGIECDSIFLLNGEKSLNPLIVLADVSLGESLAPL